MERLIKNGIFDQEYAEKVKFIQEQMKGYFEKVEPKAFLDDLTNKNVVIYRGKLSGIIDFDTISFGDRLSWLGLTCLAFEELGNSSYGEYLFNFLGYKNEDKKILNFYRLLYILEFMSEQGEKFNKNKINLDSIRIERLKKLFGKYYKLIN
ncbi:MAG: hypothetical protein Q8K26_01305 [Candidatus Gracilibacteria bacterium]|nr:hypothetical protein [Candidatus Gracilibacteria bacterium]